MARAPKRPAFGSLTRLPSGRWRARYTGPDGNRHTAPTTFDTRREAEAWLVGVQADVLRGVWQSPTAQPAAPAAVTLAEYWPTFIDYRGRELRPSTLRLYETLARRYLLAPAGLPGRVIDLAPVPLAALTTPQIRDWHRALCEQLRASTLSKDTGAAQTETRRRHPARVWAEANGLEVPTTGRLPQRVLDAWQAAGAPDPAARPVAEGPERGRTQAAQAYRLLRTVLNQALEDGLIERNPCKVRGAGVTHPAERQPLTPMEVASLAEAIAPHLRAAVLVAAYSGLRPGEVFALQRRHVNLDAPGGATLTVERTQTVTRDRQPTTGAPKTAAGLRTVTLPATVARALAEHLERYTGDAPGALVFTNENGGEVLASHRSRALAPAREAIGRPDITWHHLRHTGATLAAISGATMAELQARIGHASTRAAAIYQHAIAGRDAQIAAALDTFAATPANVLPLRRVA